MFSLHKRDIASILVIGEGFTYIFSSKANNNNSYRTTCTIFNETIYVFLNVCSYENYEIKFSEVL